MKTFEEAKEEFDKLHPEYQHIDFGEYALLLMRFYNKESHNGTCPPAEVLLMAALHAYGDGFWNEVEDDAEPNFTLLGDVFLAAKKMGYTITVTKETNS